VDVVIVGLHGEYGEDGAVQRLLTQFGVPYAGADQLGAHLASHKLLSKARAEEAGLLTPRYLLVEAAGDAETLSREGVRSFHQPVIVKPLTWGSSIGVSLAGGYAQILMAVEQLFAEGAPGVLIEEYIRGKEASVGVIERFRNEPLYALPPVEIDSSDGELFTFSAKYSGDSREYCPGRFSRVESEELMRAAKVMHRTLGLRHYSRSDFRVAPRGIYYLETNALPGLTEESLLPKSLAAVGVTFADFLTHLVNSALSR
jgi:D-alanine-D-alanine ligase